MLRRRNIRGLSPIDADRLCSVAANLGGAQVANFKDGAHAMLTRRYLERVQRCAI